MTSDRELIEAARGGSSEAYAGLYERHAESARALARHLARTAADTDDLVAEAFARVLAVLRKGAGPDEAFRPYLLMTLRRACYDRADRRRRIDLSDDIAAVADARHSHRSTAEAAIAELDRSLAVRAFRSLPERWQAVLWHVEIEGESPAEVAPLFGLTPNAVSALAHRAREGLRQSYLREHLAEAPAGCGPTVERLGAWTRGALGAGQAAKVAAHLESCRHCRDLATELAEVNAELRCVTAAMAGVPAGALFGAGVPGHGFLRRGLRLVIGALGTALLAGMSAGFASWWWCR